MTGYALGFHKQLVERDGVLPDQAEYYSPPQSGDASALSGSVPPEWQWSRAGTSRATAGRCGFKDRERHGSPRSGSQRAKPVLRGGWD